MRKLFVDEIGTCWCGRITRFVRVATKPRYGIKYTFARCPKEVHEADERLREQAQREEAAA